MTAEERALRKKLRLLLKEYGEAYSQMEQSFPDAVITLLADLRDIASKEGVSVSATVNL